MTSRNRTFLFLQGPPGPLFRRLGAAMAERGIGIHRINVSGGDLRDWPTGAVNFRGRYSDWPAFIDRFLRDHRITDLIMFGDCRPYHLSAHGIAALRRVQIHVLEEGYLRPHWMTLELGGVNARSTLSRDRNWFLREAAKLGPEPELPPVTASFPRRARDTYWYYHRVFTGRLRFPHYRSHRSKSLFVEGIGWLWKLTHEKQRSKEAEATLQQLHGKNVFVFPLQLSTDYQIRAHSLFPDMQSAASYAIESFAANAPADAHLLLKSHPLDPSFFGWRRFIARLTRRLGIEGRVHYIEAGDLESITGGARGLVCVNSTSATLALAQGVPVCTIGEAIYDIPGLTHQNHLDSFWANPTPPQAGLYPAFRRVLVEQCLVRGGLASESAVQLLIVSMLDRLGIASRQKDVAEWSGAPAKRRLIASR